MSGYRRRIRRFLWLLLVVALVVGVWQLSSLLRISTFDVRATVTDPQTGITQAIAWDGGSPVNTVNETGSTGGTSPLTGSAGSGNLPQGIGIADATPPDNGGSSPPVLVLIGGGGGGGGGGVGEKGFLLYINTDIDYGTVFPGESGIEGEFTVHLSDPEWDGTYNQVSYYIFLRTVIGYQDLSPYLSLERDPTETPKSDEPSDTTAAASLDNTPPILPYTEADTYDRWVVTLNNVPETLGDYRAEIVIEVTGHRP